MSGIMVALISVACAQSTPEKPRTLSLFVSIPPQAEILRALTGDDANIQILVQPGQSPATYDPTPRQTADLVNADACFMIGVPFERRFLERAHGSISKVTIVHAETNLPLMEMKGHDHIELDGIEGHGYDPHIWLSPVMMKGVAANMMIGLRLVDSANADKYVSNLVTLNARLDSLNAELAAILRPVIHKTIYVYHPTFGYFVAEYHMGQVALEPEGKEPDAKYLSELYDQLKQQNVTGILVQPQFSDHMARSVSQELGVKLVTVDPLAENYFDNMRAIAHQITDLLSESKQPKSDQK